MAIRPDIIAEIARFPSQRSGPRAVRGQMTRAQVQDLLAKFATENPQYRAALVADPKATIEKQFATSLGAS